MSSFTAY